MNLKQQSSTLFLRFVIALLGTGVLLLCVFALPSLWQGWEEYPYAHIALKLMTIGMYASALPFYFVLWQTLKILSLIDHDAAFSDSSVQALKYIKYAAMAISAIYIAFIPLYYPIAQADDAPGLILFGTAFACAPIAVAVFAAILQRLLQSAILFKAENDLTV